MSEPPADRKVYDESAVTAILKRASELQASSRTSRAFGLSLSELQQIAVEAGIDPRYVVAAASEVVHSPEPQINWWGGPLSHTTEWMVDGDVDEIAWEEIVAETRRHFRDTGEVRTWSNSREWAHSGQNNVQAHVTATARDGMTRLQLFWNEPTLAVAAYIPLLVLSLILLPIVFEALALTGLSAAATYFGGVGVLFVAARWFMSRLAGGKKRDLARLKMRLEQIAVNRVSEIGEPQPVTEEMPRQQIDEEIEPDEQESPRLDRGRQRA